MSIKEGNLNIYIGPGPTINRLVEITNKYEQMAEKKLSLSKLVATILRLHLAQNNNAKIISNCLDMNN